MPRMNGQQMVNALDQAVAGSNTYDLPNAKRKKIGLLETPKEWHKDVGRWGSQLLM
jgi:lactate dehydrogenase-like 2-hydroxyacid dehydrogenase